MHFFRHLRKFVDVMFQNKHIDQKQLNIIKRDLQFDTLHSDPIHHNWIKEQRVHIFPPTFVKSYQYDITINPLHYMKGMIYMALSLDNSGVKSFQFFPLRTAITPKYIPLDTYALIDLFMEDKRYYQSNINHYKDAIWGAIFNIHSKPFRRRNYVFDYRILTDGVGVSIQLLRKDKATKDKTYAEKSWTDKCDFEEATKNAITKRVNAETTNRIESIKHQIYDLMIKAAINDAKADSSLTNDTNNDAIIAAINELAKKINNINKTLPKLIATEIAAERERQKNARIQRNLWLKELAVTIKAEITTKIRTYDQKHNKTFEETKKITKKNWRNIGDCEQKHSQRTKLKRALNKPWQILCEI